MTFTQNMLKTSLTPNKLPKDSEWLFPEYDPHRLHPQKHAGIIIERILEKGSWEQIQWLFNRYGESTVTEWVKKHGFRLLSKRSFALWRVTLSIEEYAVPDWAITD